MPTLGQHIVIARAQKRWKQQQLAAAAHISQKYLSQIEHDHVDPRWAILVKLPTALAPYLSLDGAAFDTPCAGREGARGGHSC